MTRAEQLHAAFQQARDRFDEAAAAFDAAEGDLRSLFRDALLQRFEFTAELGWKTMQATAREQGLSDVNSPKAAVRAALGIGLLDTPKSVAAWLALLDARNLTSHVYDEALAETLAADVRTVHRATLHAFAAGA